MSDSKSLEELTEKKLKDLEKELEYFKWSTRAVGLLGGVGACMDVSSVLGMYLSPSDIVSVSFAIILNFGILFTIAGIGGAYWSYEEYKKREKILEMYKENKEALTWIMQNR